ncbi:uncharacterized protein F4807DRAFT_434909 [Annulohypoxylon truncatum]|uniref:uncharacterized protein n=1 Tax=Annulohypoxylon truncatum TaxID=327061 RepID=UPI0020084A50|nr:uncharacterized protein F4807DRAFT_434909 [Annulohypoxylon truncatum]KAI1207523.1 hypothetical protein F4807DRAFT_434909 [Annulohypoxylon truncatum]
MRSHPYTPPPPLPPLLSDLSTYLPNSDRRDGVSGTEVGLSDLDPDTSRLLPEKRRQHRVRVQGRLAPVRSVSIANLRSPPLRDASNRGFDEAVGGALPRRRRSEDDDAGGRGDETGEEEVEVEERDTQLRGYGIGGRGNIRRPTEVIGTSSKTSRSISSLFSSSGSGSGSGSRSPRVVSGSNIDKRWTFSGLLNRIEERRWKERNT